MAFLADSTTIDSIEFDRFTDDAKVELHGCEMAKESKDDETLISDPSDNIAADLSKKLYDAKHTKSAVIASPQKSNTNIYKDKTTNKQQDYRHGTSHIFRNGEKIGETKQNGHIDENYLAK